MSPERRWREWHGASMERRLASIEKRPPPPAPAPSLDLRRLLKDGPPADPEESARTRRWATAYRAIQDELARETERAATTQSEARTAFREKTAIGQLFR